MKTTRTIALRIAITGVVAVLSLQPLAAQKSAKEAERTQNPEDYSMLLPGENQKLLDPFVGKWQATLRTWGHGTPPPESSLKQTMDSKWVLNGNFLQTDFTTQFAGSEHVFQGIIYRGYNPADKHHVAILLSNGDARETVSTGSWDAAAKTFTFQGTEKDPHLGDAFVRKEVFRFEKPNEYFYQLFYVFKDGSEIKAAEGTFKRVS